MGPQQENNGFGPISKPRRKNAIIAAAIVLAISALIHVKTTVAHTTEVREAKEKVIFVIFGIGLLVSSLAIGEIVQRMCLLFEEIHHKETRYHGSWRKVLNSTFAFTYSGYILIVFVVSIIAVSYALYANFNAFCRSDYGILFSLNSFLVPLLSFLVGFRELSIVEVSQINETENKNVADGLAWGYYFGYLKLVLPELENQISKSEDYRFKIAKKKLFILLPKSCYTHETIDKADPRVICDGNLPAYELNRGGILKRVYMHTVHRIEMPRPDGDVEEPYYIILEYASTLMSLYDMSQNDEAGLSREQRDEQVFLNKTNCLHHLKKNSFLVLTSYIPRVSPKQTCKV